MDKSDLRIGLKVVHTFHGKGVIEEFREKDNLPLVRWDYGNLTVISPENLRKDSKNG